MRKQGLSLAFVLLLQSALAGDASEMKLQAAAGKEPPQEVSESIRKALRPGSVQVLEGDSVIYEFWFRSDLPLRSKPASADRAMQAIGETTLLGVAAVGKGQRDYRDNEIAPGVYTMRFSFIPQDGDHMGVSEFPYFSVLILTRNDTDLDGIKTYKTMVRASGRETPTEHPVVLSLRPASQAKEAPELAEPAPEHRAIRIKLPARVPDAEQSEDVGFDLVIEGRHMS
jgi:hypothetical protein